MVLFSPVPIRAVLFDVDGTLVDTSALEALRSQRNWKACVAAFGQSSLYPGIPELIDGLDALGIKWATVTTSVSYYANKLLEHHNLRPGFRVAFHDARPKPAPDPCLLAMRNLEIDVGVVGVGDSPADFGSFSAAGLTSFCAAWNPEAVTNLGWRPVQHPLELLSAIAETHRL